MIKTIKNLFRKKTIADEWSGFKFETNEDIIKHNKIKFTYDMYKKAHWKKHVKSYNIMQVYFKTGNWNYFKEAKKIDKEVKRLENIRDRWDENWNKQYKEIVFKYSLLTLAIASS